MSGPAPTSPTKLHTSHLLWLMAPISRIVTLCCSLGNKNTGKEKMGRCHEGHRGPQGREKKRDREHESPWSPQFPGRMEVRVGVMTRTCPALGAEGKKQVRCSGIILGKRKIFITTWDKRSEPQHFSMEILQCFVS